MVAPSINNSKVFVSGQQDRILLLLNFNPIDHLYSGLVQDDRNTILSHRVSSNIVGHMGHVEPPNVHVRRWHDMIKAEESAFYQFLIV
jgi:hypothetical protein